jgi:hypothetical protein
MVLRNNKIYVTQVRHSYVKNGFKTQFPFIEFPATASKGTQTRAYFSQTSIAPLKSGYVKAYKNLLITWTESFIYLVNGR